MVLGAAEAWSEEGHLADVLALIDQATMAPAATAAIAEAILDHGLLVRLLDGASPDWALVERVVHHHGVEAVPVLLDALDQSENRTQRRRLIDQLVKLGAHAEPVLVERLPGAPWYLARNILAVLSQLPTVHAVDAVAPLMRHDDARVRLEAFKVLLAVPAARNRAIAQALETDEPQMVRTAMAALGGECPPEVVAPLLSVLSHEDDDMVMHAIRLVGESDNPLVVAPLLALVRERRGLFRRWRLLPKSPVMLSALEAVVRRWPNHRPVLLAMQLAARSSDPDIHRVIGRSR